MHHVHPITRKGDGKGKKKRGQKASKQEGKQLGLA